MDLAEHLAELMQASNVAGHEGELAGLLLARWSHLVDQARVDRTGSYLGLRRGRAAANPGGRAPVVLVAVHLDAIGLMVSAVTEDGFLRFVPVGDADRRCLPGLEVLVHGRGGPLPAVVGMVPPHLTRPDERSRAPSYDRMWIDTGLPAAEAHELAPPGTAVTFRRPLLPLHGGRYSGSYLDNRAGALAVYVCLDELTRLPQRADLWVAGTTGEEFDFLGARSTAYAIRPDVSIAVDVTFGASPGAERDHFELDGGPTIMFGPDCHPSLSRFMRDVARDLQIPSAAEVTGERSGTDAAATQVAAGGNAAGVISIPLRYMHNPAETISLGDVVLAGRLLGHVISRLDEGQVAAWTSRS